MMDSYKLQAVSEAQDYFITEGLSSFSPYNIPRDSYLAPDSYPLPEIVDELDFNLKYVTRAAPMPLSPEELRLVRARLEDIFHEDAAYRMREWVEFRCNWARGLQMAQAPQHQDVDATRWFPDVTDYANKQTALYFVGVNPKPTQAGHRHGYTDSRLGCYVYRKWHQLHRGRPNFQRNGFFAKPLRVPASEAASWNAPDLVAAHRRLCDATEARLETEVIRLRNTEPGISVFLPAGAMARTWHEHGLSMCHLFRAVVLVADEHVMPVEYPVPSPDKKAKNWCWNMMAWLEQTIPECSLLMVRTGDDTHLSRPISFEGLVREGKTAPLNLEEERMAEEGEVVRVKIDVAMRFLFDVQAQEEAAIPELRQKSAMLTEERERACDVWIESVLRHAFRKEVGIDRNMFTWNAIRRVWAAQDGDVFDRVVQDETQFMSILSWYVQDRKPLELY